MKQNIQILDCTLRDGGQGLEDNAKTGISDVSFNVDDIKTIADKLAKADLDIIELGCVELSKSSKKGFAIEQSIEDISKRKPEYHKPEQLFAALYTGPDTPTKDIPKWNHYYVDVVRVILRYSELQKSLDFCKALSDKGYKVFVQPMLTMRYSEEELKHLIDETNQMNAYALYFVDSYGYMRHKDVDYLFNTYLERLDSHIRIGFHSHNNMNLAFSNALHFLDVVGERNAIVDATCMGMGQGAGNLQTELLLGYLITEFDANYHYEEVLDVCEMIESYSCVPLWGYSVTRMLPALYRVAYKYSTYLRYVLGLSYREINEILSKMPDDLRHRYTPENIKKHLLSIGKRELANRDTQ